MLSFFISSGALAFSMISIGLHNTIILIITFKSFNPKSPQTQVSSNELSHSPQTDAVLRNLLRSNRTLRNLDLTYVGRGVHALNGLLISS